MQATTTTKGERADRGRAELSGRERMRLHLLAARDEVRAARLLLKGEGGKLRGDEHAAYLAAVDALRTELAGVAGERS